MATFDTVVVGSGFGGAVMACRLAQKGAKVLVLERGRRWDVSEYPREPGDAWFYDIDEPHRQNGWIDLRVFPDMAIAQGAAVGGGSLIYANISVEAPRQVFDKGWPPEITFDELAPHYETFGRMLDVQELPDGQLTERFKLMRDGANALGHGGRFRKLPIAVTFDKDWNYGLDNPFSHEHSKEFTNAHGVRQGTCVHLGNCDIGCEVRARNTLEMNYIPDAEKAGAEFRALHIVRVIRPDGSGYRIDYDRIDRGQLIRERVTAERVVLSAGSLNSTELLLRCRDQYRTLPGVSAFLGRNWSSNGDFLTPAFYENRRISPTQGPTITSAIDFLDGSQGGQQFWIEDGGLPDLVGNFREERLIRKKLKKYQPALDRMLEETQDRDPLNNMMPWFSQGIDAADGRLYLGRKWYWPWSRMLKLDWEIDKSEAVIDAVVDMHKKLSHATGGDPYVPPTWTMLKNLVTPHPLGGCNMGTKRDNGVVDHKGAVFGYENLFVMDSSVIPEAIGRNPTRTIGALAERAAGLIS